VLIRGSTTVRESTGKDRSGAGDGVSGSEGGGSDGRFLRYLTAKRTVDDRAVNRRVLDRLAAALGALTDTTDRPLRVLDVGGGLGGALERLLERDALPADAEYTLLDVREANVAAARRRLPRWAADRGHGARETDAGLAIECEAATVDVEFVAADAFEYVRRTGGASVDDGEGTTGSGSEDERGWDLLVGQAFLDLFEPGDALETLLSALAPGGLCYFPITFDGGTVFEPTLDGELDARIERAYHAHMDDGGDSRAGRHLLVELPAAGAELLAAGSSDWVVHPRDGRYPADEGFFLAHIVETVDSALAGGDRIDGDTLADWTRQRHEQIDRGELVYVAHQLDVLGRVPGER
jgi:SAM-dependent methyltransferase